MTESDTPESLEARLKAAKAFPDGPEEHYRDVAEDAIAALKQALADKDAIGEGWCDAVEAEERLTDERDEARAERDRALDQLWANAVRFNTSYLTMECGVCGQQDEDPYSIDHAKDCLLHGYEPEEDA